MSAQTKSVAGTFQKVLVSCLLAEFTLRKGAVETVFSWLHLPFWPVSVLAWAPKREHAAR